MGGRRGGGQPLLVLFDKHQNTQPTATRREGNHKQDVSSQHRGSVSRFISKMGCSWIPHGGAPSAGWEEKVSVCGSLRSAQRIRPSRGCTEMGERLDLDLQKKMEREKKKKKKCFGVNNKNAGGDYGKPGRHPPLKTNTPGKDPS